MEALHTFIALPEWGERLLLRYASLLFPCYFCGFSLLFFCLMFLYLLFHSYHLVVSVGIILLIFLMENGSIKSFIVLKDSPLFLFIFLKYRFACTCLCLIHLYGSCFTPINHCVAALVPSWHLRLSDLVKCSILSYPSIEKAKRIVSHLIDLCHNCNLIICQDCESCEHIQL